MHSVSKEEILMYIFTATEEARVGFSAIQHACKISS